MNAQLGRHLYAFFEDHLKCQKGLRPSSISSYRDALRLFLLFVANDTRRKITRLTYSGLTSERVRRFLRFLERERGNGVRTRNQRLVAVRAFFEYLACQEPLMLAEAQRVALIPVKRTAPPETLYLERDEIEDIFASLPSEGALALRDHVLLLFLYNTGARVQEAVDLRRAHLELGDQGRVHLHGKGDKWRVCPLWKQTASLFAQLLDDRNQDSDGAVFVSRSGSSLTRFGIYKIVRRHTARVLKKGADGKARPISPHIFRHTTAVHLLEAGVEVNVIRAWLGHVSLETTNRYAEITLRMKVDALRTCEPALGASGVYRRRPVWRDDSNLFEWLQSL
jgi:integrase/recombinase XerD